MSSKLSKTCFIFYFFIFGLASTLATPPIIKEMSIRPGDAIWLEMELSEKEVQLFCRNLPIKLNKSGSKFQAMVVETYFSDFSSFNCDFKSNDKLLASVSFRVDKREFREEKLKVDPKTITLSPRNQERVNKEQVILNKIYASSSQQILFTTPFQLPMNSAITSVYGTRRVFNGQKRGQHLGIDFRANIGEKVPSANSGLVAYAGDLFYTGYTVIVDHGLDIFSVYGHLSKTLVQTGQMVKRGDLLGLSGNSGGRTTGPHLHWGVKIQGQYVDGSVVIDQTKMFFKE